MPKFSAEHVALVTGSSLGIGAATAVEFARQGARVAVHYNSSEAEADKIVAAVEAEGVTAWKFQADVSDPAQARGLGERVLETCGRVDTLVNNAGSLVGRKMFEEVDLAFWREVMAVNLDSAIFVSQPIVTHMKQRGSGAIINLGSISGHNGGGPGAIPYAVSKAAITCLTKGMAKEFAKEGIRVNAVNPGVILTPLQERFSTPEWIEKMVSGVPQGRAGAAEEVAAVIAFLASEAASHVLGESIEVNGGWLMD